MKINDYDMPEDLLYMEEHVWVKQDGDEIVMGMDDFAQQMAGEVVFVQLPDDGKKVKQGKKFAKVESGKWLGKILSPVDGVIVSVNEELEADPGLINSDCYGKGWMYRIKPKDTAPLADLITGAEAIEKWVLADVEKYKD